MFSGVNPIFGQGMTKALSDVTFLNTSLHTLFSSSTSGSSSIPPGFAQSYLKRQIPAAKGMYDLTKWLDYGYGTTIPEELKGETNETGQWLRNYWGGLMGAASTVSPSKRDHLAERFTNAFFGRIARLPRECSL